MGGDSQTKVDHSNPPNIEFGTEYPVYAVSSLVYLIPILYLGQSLVQGNPEVIYQPMFQGGLLGLAVMHFCVGVIEGIVN
jgi:hypothetical protein